MSISRTTATEVRHQLQANAEKEQPETRLEDEEVETDEMFQNAGEKVSVLATWKEPKGGYFVSLDTTRPVADRVVSLANAAGVSLTPAGATYPYGRDPHNRNIRLAPQPSAGSRSGTGDDGGGGVYQAGFGGV